MKTVAMQRINYNEFVFRHILDVQLTLEINLEHPNPRQHMAKKCEAHGLEPRVCGNTDRCCQIHGVDSVECECASHQENRTLLDELEPARSARLARIFSPAHELVPAGPAQFQLECWRARGARASTFCNSVLFLP